MKVLINVFKMRLRMAKYHMIAKKFIEAGFRVNIKEVETPEGLVFKEITMKILQKDVDAVVSPRGGMGWVVFLPSGDQVYYDPKNMTVILETEDGNKYGFADVSASLVEEEGTLAITIFNEGING